LGDAEVAFDYDMSTTQSNQAFFWIGLFGIVATGAMVGVGGDNYWGLAHLGSFDTPFASGKSTALLAAVAIYVGLSDLVAFGVIFAGAVVIVQRLRGRASPS
jgi:hypothetical protein